MTRKTEIYGTSDFVEIEGMLYDIFEDVLRFFIHCYDEIITNEKFERKNMNGEYEDFYRNKLILDYLNKNKDSEDFKLYNLDFIPGADEIDPNTYLSTGNPDIKIINVNFLLATEFRLDKDPYFTFECKRFGDNASPQSYVEKGMQRFVEHKQSGFKYSTNLPFAGMIGFVEKGDPEDIVDNINAILQTHDKIDTIKELTQENIENDFNFSYCSKHKRGTNLHITLHHLMYDYTKIVQ